MVTVRDDLYWHPKTKTTRWKRRGFGLLMTTPLLASIGALHWGVNTGSFATLTVLEFLIEFIADTEGFGLGVVFGMPIVGIYGIMIPDITVVRGRVTKKDTISKTVICDKTQFGVSKNIIDKLELDKEYFFIVADFDDKESEDVSKKNGTIKGIITDEDVNTYLNRKGLLTQGGADNDTTK